MLITISPSEMYVASTTFFFATTDRRLTYAAELSQKFFFPKSHEFFLFHFTGLGTIVNI